MMLAGKKAAVLKDFPAFLRTLAPLRKKKNVSRKGAEPQRN
jgi:hypothetical protein